MRSKKHYHITEPLAVHAEQLNKVMLTGRYGEWEELAVQPLKEPLSYGGKAYGWVKLGRLITDKSEPPTGSDLAGFHPILGIKLLDGPDQDCGFITDITYAPFSLSAPFFVEGQAPIGGLLRPVSFDTYIGEGDADEAETELVRDGQLGTEVEFSTIARAAGHSIIAAVEVLQDYTLEQVEEWYRPQARR